jgi:hypothetical protein
MPLSLDRGGGTLTTSWPPNTNKETGIPRDGRTTCTGLWPQYATLRAKSAPRVWKGATEEGARWSTLKSLHWGSRGQSKDGTLEDGRAFVNSHGHPLRRSTQYGDTYAPEGMGPRSGVHDGKGARRGTLVKGRTKLRFSTE